VTFVLYADGSTFGASEWATNLTRHRQTLLEVMRNLLRAFDESKQPGLKSAIEKAYVSPKLRDEFSPELSFIRQKFQEEGSTATVSYLRKSIANAERHLEPAAIAPS